MSELLRNMEPNLSAIYPQEISNKQDGGLAHKPIAPLLLDPEYSEATCPFCYAVVKTRVKYVAAALCFGICCYCLPYRCFSAKKLYCPNCNRYMGT